MIRRRAKWSEGGKTGHKWLCIIGTSSPLTQYPVRSLRNFPESRSLSGEPDYFGRNKISSGGDLSHYSSASLY